MPITIIAIILVVAGTIMWFVSISSLIGYAIGIASGIILILAVVKKLGSKSRKSLVASSLFYKLTKYKATIYHIHSQQSQSASATVYGNAHDYADLMDVLKQQMKFPSPIAKEAAKYAMNAVGDKPLQEKIMVALQYLGGNGQEDETEKA